MKGPFTFVGTGDISTYSTRSIPLVYNMRTSHTRRRRSKRARPRPDPTHFAYLTKQTISQQRFAAYINTPSLPLLLFSFIHKLESSRVPVTIFGIPANRPRHPFHWPLLLAHHTRRARVLTHPSVVTHDEHSIPDLHPPIVSIIMRAFG